MSKFLKVIVNIFLVCAIAVAAAILIPPVAGVNTTIVDSQSMETNLPMGSVTYSKDTYITNLETGDNILDQTSASTYKYTIVSADTATGNFEVRDAYNSSAETKNIQILNSTPKVFLTVPFIGYVVYAMHSIEGIIIVALVILLMVILFILSELWKKESEEEFMEEYYAAEEEKAAAKKAEEYEDYEDSDTEYDDEADDEYEGGYDEEDDEYSDEYDDDSYADYETIGGDTEEFTPPFTIARAEEDKENSDSCAIKGYGAEEADDDAGMEINAASGMAAIAAGGFSEEDTAETEDTVKGEDGGKMENAGKKRKPESDARRESSVDAGYGKNEKADEPENETDEISSGLEAVLEKYTKEEGNTPGDDSESSALEEDAEAEEEILIADDEVSPEQTEVSAETVSNVDFSADAQTDTDSAADTKAELNKGSVAFEEDFKVETDPEDPDRFVPVKRPSYDDILVKAEEDGLDPEIEKDKISGVQIVDFSELL